MQSDAPHFPRRRAIGWRVAERCWSSRPMCSCTENGRRGERKQGKRTGRGPAHEPASREGRGRGREGTRVLLPATWVSKGAHTARGEKGGKEKRACGAVWTEERGQAYTRGDGRAGELRSWLDGSLGRSAPPTRPPGPDARLLPLTVGTPITPRTTLHPGQTLHPSPSPLLLLLLIDVPSPLRCPCFLQNIPVPQLAKACPTAL